MTLFRLGGAALALALCLLMTPAAFAQSTDTRVQELEREVQKLKEEIAAMKQSPESGESGRMAEIERRLEVLASEIEKMKIGEAAVSADESDYGLGPAASKIYRTERGLSIGGYGEILYQKFDDERDNGTASGRNDQFDLLRGILYFGYKWNDRFVFNTEVEYEHAGEEEVAGGDQRERREGQRLDQVQPGEAAPQRRLVEPRGQRGRDQCGQELGRDEERGRRRDRLGAVVDQHGKGDDPDGIAELVDRVRAQEPAEWPNAHW
jgi:hypothetical protein